MAENNFDSGLKLKIGMIMLVLGTILLGTIGGAVMGGVVGYSMALRSQPEPIAINQSSMPVTHDLEPVMQSSNAVDTGTSTKVITENDALIAAVETVNSATVTVLNQNFQGISSGSGVIVDKAGYIVTNYHVVENAEKTYVILARGGRIDAQIVGTAAEFDLAVLKIDADYVPAVAYFGDSSSLHLGERVAAIGSALGGFRNTVTSGVVSAHNRSLGGQNGLLQTDTPINHGNSGGPLINLKGEVVGINVMVLRGNGFSGDVAEGLGFAIPSNTVATVVKQLIETGRAEMPFLGVSYSILNPQLSMEYGIMATQGAYIEEVLQGMAADEAGVKKDDIIIAINGRDVEDQHPLGQQLMMYSVGETVELTILRGEKEIILPVTLGKRPEN